MRHRTRSCRTCEEFMATTKQRNRKLTRKEEAWAGAHSSYDYFCPGCGNKPDLFVRNRDRDNQICPSCQVYMSRLFSIPRPKTGYNVFKPFVAYTLPDNDDGTEKTITSDKQWKIELKKEGLIEGYRGGGRSISKETLEDGKELVNR